MFLMKNLETCFTMKKLKPFLKFKLFNFKMETNKEVQQPSEIYNNESKQNIKSCILNRKENP